MVALRRRSRAHVSWSFVGQVAAACLAASGCGPSGEPGSGSGQVVSAVPASPASASSNAPASSAQPGRAVPDPHAVAASCALPEAPIAKLGAPDKAFMTRLDEVGERCDPLLVSSCEAAKQLIERAKSSVPTASNRAPEGLIAACVAGLGHKKPAARYAAADCLAQVAYSVADTSPMAVALFEKLERVDPADADHTLAYSNAIMNLDAARAGLTCRVLRLVDKLPKNGNDAANLLSSLHPLLGRTNSETFDYAYALVMTNQTGVGVAAAGAIVRQFAPESRKAEVCDKMGDMVETSEEWGPSAKAIWEAPGCKHREKVVPAVVAKLAWIEAQSDEAAIERALLSGAFVEGLARWEGLPAADKRAFCDAASSLAGKAKLDSAKKLGRTLASGCAP